MDLLGRSLGCEERLDISLLERSLSTTCFGRNVVYLPSTRSTNDVAKEVARTGSPEGTLVITDEQTAGRGRLGRTWLAPSGSSLLMSLVFRPVLPPTSVFTMTMLTGVAVASAVDAVTGLVADVKWPNDVLVKGRKLVGILSEMNMAGADIEFVVVGIGINVNSDLSGFHEISDTATSLSTELGHQVDRIDMLCGVLQEFERHYMPLVSATSKVVGTAEAVDKWRECIFDEWRARLVTLGRVVTVDDGQSVEEGLAEDVEIDGTLLVRRSDGSLRKVMAGDVSLKARKR